MKTKAVLMAILFVTGALTAALGEAIVTLKSGEVLHGDVVSDTNDVLQIRAFSVNRTISSLRNVPHADIQNVYNETPAEAAERIAYFALSEFQLNPDQEQSTDFYTRWIAAFEKFLTDYPKSDKTQIIKQHIEACQAELKHAIAGEVKFENKWMTPVEKRVLSLNRHLADLENQLDRINADRADDRLRMDKADEEATDAKDRTSRDAAVTKRTNYLRKLGRDEKLRSDVESNISRARSDLKVAQRDYNAAKPKLAEAERLAYEAVQKYRLNPDQEFTATQYDAGLAVCQKYLESYPSGEYAAAVRQQSAQLQQEKEQVEKGLVKFGGQWMSASQKAAEQERQAQLQTEIHRQVLAAQEKEAQLQAERNRQVLVAQEKEAQLQAERNRQALVAQEKEAQHQRMMNLLSELGQIIVSIIVLSSLVVGFAVSLRFGARLAKIENVTSRTALLAGVTALVAMIVIFLCCIPLGRLALITFLVMGVVATSFIVKAIFRATWEKALLTNIFALTATTVGMLLLVYFLIFLGVSYSIPDMVKPR
jgi:hypothetical protein